MNIHSCKHIWGSIKQTVFSFSFFKYASQMAMLALVMYLEECEFVKFSNDNSAFNSNELNSEISF